MSREAGAAADRLEAAARLFRTAAAIVVTALLVLPAGAWLRARAATPSSIALVGLLQTGAPLLPAGQPVRSGAAARRVEARFAPADPPLPGPADLLVAPGRSP